MAKSMRNRHTQAILAVDWTIVGTAEGGLDETLDNACIQMIIAALGVGIDLGDGMQSASFRLDLLRYGKIVLALDDRPQDRAIRGAVLAFLDRYMRPVLTAGYVYTAIGNPTAKTIDTEFERTVMVPETRNLARVLG